MSTFPWSFPPCVFATPRSFSHPSPRHMWVIFKIAPAVFFFYCHYHSRAATRLKEARTLTKSSMLQCVIRLHHMTTTLTSNATKIHKHTHAHTFSTAYILSTFCCTLYIFSFLFVQPLRGTCMFDSTWHATRHSPLKGKRNNSLHSSRRHATTWLFFVAVVSTQVEAFSHHLFCRPWLQRPCFSDGPTGIDWLSDPRWQIKTDKKMWLSLDLLTEKLEMCERRGQMIYWFIIRENSFAATHLHIERKTTEYQIHANTVYGSQNRRDTEGITRNVSCRYSTHKYIMYRDNRL